MIVWAGGYARLVDRRFRITHLADCAGENRDAFILCRSFTAFKPALNQCLRCARKKIDPIQVGTG